MRAAAVVLLLGAFPACAPRSPAPVSRSPFERVGTISEVERSTTPAGVRTLKLVSTAAFGPDEELVEGRRIVLVSTLEKPPKRKKQSATLEIDGVRAVFDREVVYEIAGSEGLLIVVMDVEQHEGAFEADLLLFRRSP